MKNLIKYGFIAVVSCFLLSCNRDATNNLKCYLQVKEKHPKSIIFPIPNEDYKFITVDTCGKVTYVETMDGSTPNVTDEIVVSNCN